MRRVRREHQLAGDGNCAARGEIIAQISVVALKDDLNGGKAGSIGQFDKAEGLSLAYRADPAADRNHADERLRRFLNLG